MKKKQAAEAAAEAKREQAEREVKIESELQARQATMEKQFAEKEAAAALEYDTLRADVVSLQDTIQLQVEAAAASGASVADALAHRISFSTAGAPGKRIHTEESKVLVLFKKM